MTIQKAEITGQLKDVSFDCTVASKRGVLRMHSIVKVICIMIDCHHYTKCKNMQPKNIFLYTVYQQYIIGTPSNTCLRLMRLFTFLQWCAHKDPSDLWVAPQPRKVVWRSATTMLGEQCVMMPLEPMMPMWLAGSLDLQAQV